MALILAIVLTLTPFPRNKTEAYYVGTSPWVNNPHIPAGNGISRHPSPGGFIFFETKTDDPNSPVLDPGSGDSPSESNSGQNKSKHVPENIFSDIMPPLWSGHISYSASPADLEWTWPDFTAMPSSSPILLWTPDFSSNQYWLYVYPVILFYFP